MRMEELSDSKYIKNTDTVERYLLNLVQEYFKTTNVASATSREFIIKRAVERMKEEITFDSIGVLSITLPDGEMRTGAVTISLEDLNGEPLISPKLTAFNVNFGTEQNTACEGNDPRLSDARKPLAHEHSISDITGLEGILSTLAGKLDRVDDLKHTHENKSVIDMLVYTGDKSTIDLTKLDTIENKVLALINEIENDIAAYTQNINNKVQSVNQDVTNIRSEISALSQQVTQANKKYYGEAKTYVDENIKTLKDFIETAINNLLTKDMLTGFVDAANNTYSLVGSMSFFLNTIFNLSTSNLQYTADIDISAAILNELDTRAQDLTQCQIEAILEYTSNGKKQYCQLPYVIVNDYLLDGTLQAATCFSTKQIRVTLEIFSGSVPDVLKGARIIYNVYSKKAVML